MSTIGEAITSALLDASVRLDGDALAEAERSVSARLVFNRDGSLITPLRVVVQGEKAARPELFENKK